MGGEPSSPTLDDTLPGDCTGSRPVFLDIRLGTDGACMSGSCGVLVDCVISLPMSLLSLGEGRIVLLLVFWPVIVFRFGFTAVSGRIKSCVMGLLILSPSLLVTGGVPSTGGVSEEDLCAVTIDFRFAAFLLGVLAGTVVGRSATCGKSFVTGLFIGGNFVADDSARNDTAKTQNHVISTTTNKTKDSL